MSRHRRPRNSDTLGGIVAEDYKVMACCDTCRVWKDIDVPQLARIKGEDYCLWNRTTRCRMTPDCTGKSRFFINAGRSMTEKMYDADR